MKSDGWILNGVQNPSVIINFFFEGTMKRIFSLLLCALLLCTLAACATSYAGDERLGTYKDKETGCYTLVLLEDGTGSITHESNTVLPTEEEIFFEIREGVLYLNGKSANGAVIGQTEYYGKLSEADGSYTVLLKSDLTGISLGTFVKEK